MGGSIDISTLSQKHHQALACLFYARLPKEDPRYKDRTACFELFQKRFNIKVNTYRHSKDTYDAYFDSNNRIGWVGTPIISRGREYQDVYEAYKDFDIDILADAVTRIKELYSANNQNYLALRLKDPETVHALLNGTKTFTVDGIYDLAETLTIGRIIFVALGGDKGDSKVDWQRGFYAIAHVTRTPYDKGYSKTKKGQDYFKFDMEIDIVLDKPIPRSGFMYYPDTYDAAYIGLELNRDRTQANSSLDDNMAVAIIRVTLDKMPHLKSQFESIFTKDFMDRVLGSATILVPASVEYGEDLKVAVNQEFNDKDIDEEEIVDTSNLVKYGKNEFLEQVYMDERNYDLLVSVLENKKNIILQGAPGVGKTFMAKRLAYSLIGYNDDSRVQMIQFHQSYSYEDFIVGYRPSKDGFVLEYGPFYDFCKKAERTPGPHFFIIDEINRGNVSKIFGELLMLIEHDKRSESLDLLYTKESFRVPENVYIIGMMNTADRGLALIDYALRRRFAFFEVVPAFDNEKFKNMIEKTVNPSRINHLIAYIKKINEAIRADESLGAGFEIGHSYFCSAPEASEKSNQEGLLNDWIKMTIEYEIIPLIKEYWFDNPDKASEWSNKLREAKKDESDD